MPKKRIVIIGGGFSGAMTAVNLVRLGAGNLQVTIIDAADAAGRGVAYGTREPCHLLNVPAGGMSAFPDDPGHFLRFVQRHREDTTAADFVERRLYGEYLRSIVEEARLNAGSGLGSVSGRVVDIRPGDRSGAVVVLDDGRSFPADRIVLATGNQPPAVPPPIDGTDFEHGERYLNDPWDVAAIERLGRPRRVLLIGCGLTMVDTALRFRRRGCMSIHAVSRRGLLPHAHALPSRPSTPPSDCRFNHLPGNLRECLRIVRRSASSERAAEWQETLRALHPWTPQVWARLPLEDRARFVRHLVPYWDVHRHRMPPTVAAALKQMVDSKLLTVRAARIRAIEESRGSVWVYLRGRDGIRRRIPVDVVVNCTGPCTDLRRVRDPLLTKLAARGSITPDPLHLGLRTDDRYAVIDRSGSPSTYLHYIGAWLRAAHWESTAVPELRVHAKKLAEELLASLLPRVGRATGDATTAARGHVHLPATVP